MPYLIFINQEAVPETGTASWRFKQKDIMNRAAGPSAGCPVEMRNGKGLKREINQAMLGFDQEKIISEAGR
jgi:hypothetical protein